MRRHQWKYAGALALTFLLTGTVLAQEEESDLQKQLAELKKGQEEIQLQIKLMQEIEALKKSQDEMRKDIADIKRMLQQAGAPARAAAAPSGPDIRDLVLDVSGRPSRGEARAPLTLVEFTDYQ